MPSLFHCLGQRACIRSASLLPASGRGVPLPSIAIYALGTGPHGTMSGIWASDELLIRSSPRFRFLSIYLFIYSSSRRIALPSRSHFHLIHPLHALYIVRTINTQHYVPSISGLSRHLPIDSPWTHPKSTKTKGIVFNPSTPLAQLLRHSVLYCWSLPVSTARPPHLGVSFLESHGTHTPSNTRHVVSSLPAPAFVLLSLAFLCLFISTISFPEAPCSG